MIYLAYYKYRNFEKNIIQEQQGIFIAGNATEALKKACEKIGNSLEWNKKQVEHLDQESTFSTCDKDGEHIIKVSHINQFMRL